MKKQFLRVANSIFLVGCITPLTVLAETSADEDSLNIYGSLRPTYAIHLDQNGETSSDVLDALSRVGISGSQQLTPDITGIFKGEWKVTLQDDGTLGDSRQVWAGLKGKYGKVAIGKQRPPHYTLIAEPVDIFNHAASPYAYDNISPFFVNNTLTYGYSAGHFNLLAMLQNNGSEGDDSADLVNVGAGYSTNLFSVAVAYLNSTAPGTPDPNTEGDETSNIALSGTISLGNLYLAAAYQDINIEPVTGAERDPSTIDVSAAYKLGKGYKAKVGFFDFDDDQNTGSNSHDGYNLTLERQMTDKFRVHAEYLARSFDQQPDDFESFTIGIRYDFDHKI